MTKDEALRLALEALEYEAQKGNDNAYQFEREAIKAALEAKDEAVAWVCMKSDMHDIDFDQPEIDAIPVGTMLYTIQPQRTWVGLTDEEVGEWTPEIHVVIQAIEAKLKEKNT